MPITRCRVCGGALSEPPLLRYHNMPCAAQSFPDAATLDSDQGVDVEVRQCSGCGLVQLSNNPVPYYKDVIRAAAVSAEMQQFRLEQFRKFAERFSLKGKKVVEIGCGRGEFLSILQQAGMNACGVEHAPAAVAECRSNGLNAIEGFLPGEASALAPAAPFDAFFILNFFEHLPDPGASLRGIAELLSEDALGLVEVPNFDMILSKNLFSEFIGDHLFYFTRETLERTLGLNGFDIVEVNEIWHDYILSAVVRKRRPTDLSAFGKQQAQLEAELDAYLRSFGKGRVAVWGAGHQALAVLALAKMGDRIRYVIDSAPFKQNKFTPATHLPIQSPAVLNSDPVDAVIVMAASYSDEVARTIREKFDPKLQVCILRDFGLETVANRGAE